MEELGLGREEELELEEIPDAEGLALGRGQKILIRSRRGPDMVATDRRAPGLHLALGQREQPPHLDDRAVDEMVQRAVAVVGGDGPILGNHRPDLFGTTVVTGHHAVPGQHSQSSDEPTPRHSAGSGAG